MDRSRPQGRAPNDPTARNPIPMSSDTRQRPHVHEMVVIHRLFRREAVLLPRIVRAVPAGDRVAVERTADATAEYIGGLHHHHAVEDELIWPLLAERAEATTDLREQMEKQHTAIDDSLTAVTAALTPWTATCTASDGEVLAAALDAHRLCLVEHLDAEEEFALPQIADHLTVAEWDAVGDRGLERVPRDKLLLALGAILEDATAEEQAYFLSKAPLPGRIAWRLFGRRQYAARCRALRAPLHVSEAAAQ